MATGDKLVNLDALKAVHDADAADVADLKSAFCSGLVDGTLSGWEKGSFNTTNGTNYSDNTRIRNQTKVGFSTGVCRFKLATGYSTLMFAWDLSGNYVGAYKTDGTWTAVASGWKSVTEFDLSTVPNYVIKFAMTRVPSSSDISANEGSNCVLQYYTDKTLSIENKAADAKMVGDKISDLTSYLDDAVPWDYDMSNIRISAGGVLTPNPAYLVTPIFDIASGNTFSIASGSNQRYRLAFYNADDSFALLSNTWQTGNYTITNSYPKARVNISFTDGTTPITVNDVRNTFTSSARIPIVYKTELLENSIQEIETEIDDIIQENKTQHTISILLENDDVYNGFYVSVDPNNLSIIKTDNTKSITVLVPIFGASALNITSFCNGYYGILFFDKYKNICGSFMSTGGTTARTINCPDNTAYFAATIQAADYTDPSDLNISYVFDSVRYAKTFDADYRIDEPYEMLLRNKTGNSKILCIGDSLTESANANDITYPSFLALRTGITCDNAGHSGYAATNWWSDYGINFDFSGYQSFVIWLGTNGALTDTLDTDVIPYSDYNDFANTETGCYCKIISKIISQVPKAKIFLVGIFYGVTISGTTTTNKVLPKIADLYPDNVLGVIETKNDDLFTQTQDNVLHPYDTLHFGKYGNFVVSGVILQGMRHLIEQKPELFARYNSPIT